MVRDAPFGWPGIMGWCTVIILGVFSRLAHCEGCSFSIMLWYHAVWYGLSAPLAKYILNTKCRLVPDNFVVS